MAVAGIRTSVFATLGLLGCTSIAADARTFGGTRWQVTAINGHATPRSGSFHIKFSRGSFSAQMGCNTASGAYRVEGDFLRPGIGRRTEKACDALYATEFPLMTYERWGFAVLSKPMRMSWRSGRELILSNVAGSIELERLP